MSNQEFESRLKHLLKMQSKLDWLLVGQCVCVFLGMVAMVFLLLLMGD